VFWLTGLVPQFEAGGLAFAWSQAVQNHAHDSIGGCSVESVHIAVEQRFAKCEEISSQMANEPLLTLAGSLEKQIRKEVSSSFCSSSSTTIFKSTNIFPSQKFRNATRIVVWNPLPVERRDLVIFTLFDSWSCCEELFFPGINFYAVDVESGQKYPVSLWEQDTKTVWQGRWSK
jgi:hypothetical protein